MFFGFLLWFDCCFVFVRLFVGVLVVGFRAGWFDLYSLFGVA